MAKHVVVIDEPVVTSDTARAPDGHERCDPATSSQRK